ncbi:hypothetical protein [Aquibacillus kalidii]|uniref:hypothetical protein n=1 Tax=Aquibacillus kalidii TaxID=2762597 RepID=UPI00164670C6|nr:hypothetical protein [Aquibacillus kalidii]
MKGIIRNLLLAVGVTLSVFVSIALVDVVYYKLIEMGITWEFIGLFFTSMLVLYTILDYLMDRAFKKGDVSE